MRIEFRIPVLIVSLALTLASMHALPRAMAESGIPCQQQRVNKQNAGDVIAACTKVIDGGKTSRDELANAHYMRGWGQYKQGANLTAADDFRRVMDLLPNGGKLHRESINWLATITSEIANGCDQTPFDKLDPEAVIPACSKAIDAKHLFKDDDVATLYFRRGRAYQKRDEFALALRDYDDALSLIPDWGDVQNNRGGVLKEQRQFNQAIAAFDRAIAIDPDYWQAHYNRGSVHEARKDYSRAIVDYRSVVRLLKPSDFTKNLEKKIAEFESTVAAARTKTNSAADESPADVDPRVKQLQVQIARFEALRDRNVMSRAEADAGIRKARETIAEITGQSPPVLSAKESTASKQDNTPGDTAKIAATPSNEHRVALVIGNSEYTLTTGLDNPRNDAELMASSLRSVGFEVDLVTDADQRAMKRAMINFGRRLKGDATTGLFYYAGHGVQVRGQNYLIPVDANIRAEDEVDLEGINVNDFLAVMNQARSRVNIVILDACRNNPFARSFRSGTRGGLAPVQAPKGTFIAYATAPGQVALDGENTQNSPYTAALAKALAQHGISLETVFKRTRARVLEITNDSQVPWETSSITGEFYFRPPN